MCMTMSVINTMKVTATTVYNKTLQKVKVMLREKKKEITTREFWIRKLPIIGWLSNYSASYFITDMIAGITSGFILIPNAIAAAAVVGLLPQHGLYSALVPSFVYLVFGPSKDIVIGPGVVTGMLVKPYAEKFGLEVLVLICFLSGVIIIILGILQLGFLVEFISMPVCAGFLSACVVTVITSQIAPFLGIKRLGSTFLEQWKNLPLRISETQLWDPILCSICIVSLVLLKYLQKYSTPQGKSKWEKMVRGMIRYISLGRNSIILIVGTAIIAGVIYITGNSYVVVTGPVKEGLPEFKVPKFEVIYGNKTLSFQAAAAELSSAIVIPFVLILQLVVLSKSFAKGRKVDATQEILALGLINTIASFFQAFPVTVAISVTAVNNSSGVRTPIGGIFTGGLVILCLLFLAKYLKYVPRPVLAAIVVCAVISTMEIVDVTRELWRSKKIELIPLYTTFITGIFLGLDYGIIFGILVNLPLLLYDSARPKIIKTLLKVESRDVLVICPDRGLTYPAAEYVKETITTACEGVESNLLIVIDGRSIYNMDATTIKVLKTMLKELIALKNDVILWNWNQDMVKIFVALDRKGHEHFSYSDTLQQLIKDKYQKTSAVEDIENRSKMEC